MTRPTWRDVTFLAALPFTVLFDLVGAAFRPIAILADRIDAKYAGALGGEDDET